MQLKGNQLKAYDLIHKFLKNPMQKIFICCGYAGTGKTTLMKFLIDSIDQKPLACAPTWKAASVLSKKLEGFFVSSIHQLLYAPQDNNIKLIKTLEAALLKDPDNEEIQKELEEARKSSKKKGVQFYKKITPGEYNGKTIFIDEGSMVTNRMINDFIQSGAKIVVFGDDFQLQPVGEKPWLHTATPDIKLEEVHRQALDSDIIQASMQIRKNGVVKFSQFKNSNEFINRSKGEMAKQDWIDCDQVLTGKNVARRKVNRFFRTQLGHNEKGIFPVKGEKIICLKNQIEDHGLINGIVGYATDDFNYHEAEGLHGSVSMESVEKYELPIWKQPFEATYKNVEEDPYFVRQDLSEFDYGYCITVHKSQGSEWPFVILADDGTFLKGRAERKNWLYTAMTRASKKFIWVN